MKEAEIIQCLRATDNREVDRGFAFLYEEYYPIIRAFVVKNNGTAEDSSDIFQDALIVFYHKIRSKGFELTCTIKTFIYSICRNLWLKRLLARKQELTAKEQIKAIDVEYLLSDIFEENEQTLAVAQTLKEMGGNCKRLLIHFYFDGFDTEEITDIMGYANQQVTRNKKSLCLKKLRTLFKNKLSRKI